MQPREALTVAAPSAHLPAKEVLRFGAAIFGRILVGVVFGLAVTKTLQLAAGLGAAQAILFGEWCAAGMFAGSLMLKRIPWPEMDYGPDIDPALLDDETAR